VALHALRGRAARIIAGRCRCGIAVAEDHVADAVFVMVYGIRRAPRLRISATTTLAYLCGVARNEWRWGRWRRAREADAAAELAHQRPDQRSSPGPDHRDAGMTPSAFTPAMGGRLHSLLEQCSFSSISPRWDPYTKCRAGILVPVLVPVGDRIPP
jgi:hypothetical protein